MGLEYWSFFNKYGHATKLLKHVWKFSRRPTGNRTRGRYLVSAVRCNYPSNEGKNLRAAARDEIERRLYNPQTLTGLITAGRAAEKKGIAFYSEHSSLSGLIERLFLLCLEARFA